MQAPRSADWGPTTETTAGRPHLKPRVGGCEPGAEASCPPHRPKAADLPGAHATLILSAAERPAVPHSVPKQLDQLASLLTQAQSTRKTGCMQLGPKAADLPAPLDSVPKQLIPPATHTTYSQSCGKTGRVRPRPKATDQLIKRLAAGQGPHLKVPVLNNSYRAPAHRALQGLLAL